MNEQDQQQDRRGWREWTTSRMVALHLAAAVALVAAVLLGRWQLDAWSGHREDRAAQLAEQPPVPLASVFGPDDAFPGEDSGRPVEMRGSWLPGDPLTVTDRIQHGDLGTWAVAMLQVCDDPPCAADDPALPVVLGWSAAERPALAPPQGSVTVTGRIAPAEQDDARDADPTDGVLPSLRIPDLVRIVEPDLYSGFVFLDTPAAVRADLEPVTADALPRPPASTGLRNLLYAVQWWVFGAFALVVWWRWTRDELETARAERRGAARIASEA